MNVRYHDLFPDSKDAFVKGWREAFVLDTTGKVDEIDGVVGVDDLVVIFGHGDRATPKVIESADSGTKIAMTAEQVAAALNPHLDAGHKYVLCLMCEGSGRRYRGELLVKADQKTDKKAWIRFEDEVYEKCFIKQLALELKKLTPRSALRIGGFASSVINPPAKKVPIKKTGGLKVLSKLPDGMRLEGSKTAEQPAIMKVKDPTGWYDDIPPLWVNGDGKWCTFENTNPIKAADHPVKFVPVAK